MLCGDKKITCALQAILFSIICTIHIYPTLWSSSSSWSSWWLVFVFLPLFHFFWFFISFALQLCLLDVVDSIIQFILIDSEFIIIIECCWLSALFLKLNGCWTLQSNRATATKNGKQREKEEKNTRGDGLMKVFIHLLATRWRPSYCSCNFTHNHFDTTSNKKDREREEEKEEKNFAASFSYKWNVPV